MTRIVIVNADDFGQTPGINRGIVEAHERGLVTSTSMLVNHPAAEEAAAYARRRPDLAVGLHADFGEWGHVDGEWYAIYEMPADDPESVRSEVRRKLETFRRLIDADPTHLDSHQHAHFDEPVRSAMIELAEELRVPLRAVSDDIGYRGDFFGQDDVRPFPEGITREALIELLLGLPDGITEVGCHPGYAEGLDSGYRTEREAEIGVLCDAVVRETIAAAGIELRSFRTAFS